jgi:hypothetical protein
LTRYLHGYLERWPDNVIRDIFVHPARVSSTQSGQRSQATQGHVRVTDQHGARWTDEADAELRNRVAAKQTIAQIAREMGRTMDAIRGRAATLRITLRSSQRPWRDGVTRRPSE